MKKPNDIQAPHALQRPVRIQSIGRAAALLDAMADGGWIQLGKLAKAVNLQKTTTFNLVTALVDVGLVENSGQRGAYRLGLRHVEFGRAVERRLEIAPLARPTLVKICAESRETVNLAIPRPADVLIVESIEGSQSVRVTAYAGTRAAYHSTACGRAILAFETPVHRDSILGPGPLRAMTARTITDRNALETLLTTCRKTGWVAEREENELGSSCVAAPIFGRGGQAVASVSIAGPVSRMDDAMIAHLGTMLVGVLKPLSAMLQTGVTPG